MSDSPKTATLAETWILKADKSGLALHKKEFIADRGSWLCRLAHRVDSKGGVVFKSNGSSVCVMFAMVDADGDSFTVQNRAGQVVAKITLEEIPVV